MVILFAISAMIRPPPPVPYPLRLLPGIIGTTRSQTTTMVTEVTRATNIPVVGISATLAELSDKSKYPGFVRTVPSDNLQAEVRKEEQ